MRALFTTVLFFFSTRGVGASRPFRELDEHLPTYTMDDVGERDGEENEDGTTNDCWTVIDCKVYDVTALKTTHSGGEQCIQDVCGKDGTESYENNHGTDIGDREIKPIGLLKKTEEPSAHPSPFPTPFGPTDSPTSSEITQGPTICPILACCEEDCCGPFTSFSYAIGVCIYDGTAPTGWTGDYSAQHERGCVERSCCEIDCCSVGTSYDESIGCCVGGNS